MVVRLSSSFLILVLTVTSAVLSGPTSARATEPANFLFLDADDMSDHRDMLARPDIVGGQIIYPWRQLEPQKDLYDLSKLQRDLAVARGQHKKLWVTISDRTFGLKWKGLPDYLSEDPEYAGGTVFQYSYPGTQPGTVK